MFIDKLPPMNRTFLLLAALAVILIVTTACESSLGPESIQSRMQSESMGLIGDKQVHAVVAINKYVFIESPDVYYETATARASFTNGYDYVDIGEVSVNNDVVSRIAVGQYADDSVAVSNAEVSR